MTTFFIVFVWVLEDIPEQKYYKQKRSLGDINKTMHKLYKLCEVRVRMWYHTWGTKLISNKNVNVTYFSTIWVPPNPY